MFAAALHDNPILVYVLAALIVVFVLLMARIIVGRRVAADKRPKSAGGGGRREPGFSGSDLAGDFVPRQDRSLLVDEGGRHGSGRLVLAFVLGVAVGFGGLALAGRPGLVSKARLVIAELLSDAASGIGGGKAPEPIPDKTVQPEAAPARAPEPAPATPSPAIPEPDAPAAPPEPVFDKKAAAASFVERMKSVLPRTVNATTTLVRADVDDEVITLGFSLAEVIPAESFQKLGDDLKRHFDDTVCRADKPDELRALNDSGITFWIVYTDQVGTTVARMLIAPKYCDRLAPVSPR